MIIEIIPKNISAALVIAVRLTSKSISDPSHRHTCVIFDDKGRIHSCGYNVEVVNNKAQRYHQFSCWHAETMALSKLRNHVSQLNLLSIRINKAGLLRNAKPCNECQSVINRCQIGSVYYSNSEGLIVCEKQVY